MNNTCKICGSNILLMCRKNTSICGELCQKKAEEKPKKRSRRPRR